MFLLLSYRTLMLRLLLPTAAAVIVVLGAGDLFAQGVERWPAVEITRNFRGPGFYLSFLKILACWLLFLAWIMTTDWANRDGQLLRLNYTRWNSIIFGTFMGSFVLVWLIPYFWLGFPLLLISYAAPLTAYLILRKKQADERLENEGLESLCRLLAEVAGYGIFFLGMIIILPIAFFVPLALAAGGSNRGAFKLVVLVLAPGLMFLLRFGPQLLIDPLEEKIQKLAYRGKADPHTKGPPVLVFGRGGADEREDNARTLMARQAPGLRDARQILADGLEGRGSAIMLDFTQQAVAVRYMIDGVWINREPIEREKGDPALEALKALCGLDPQNRQGRQEGTFGAEHAESKYLGTVASQGTKMGERVLIQLEQQGIRLTTFDEIGMREKIQEQMKELLDSKKGLMLFSAMPAAGLRTTVDIALHNTDRLTREFMAVEEESNRFEEIENIPATTYNAAEGQSPVDVLPKMFRMDPNVVVIRDLVNAETVNLICEEMEANRLFVSVVRAKDSAEALLRVLALGAAPGEFAKLPVGVISQRLVRKLCKECKEAYAPTPQVLGQLGIPEGRVKAFYRPPQQPEEVCEHCGGIGYHGRTAIFELLPVGDNVRKVLATAPKLDLLRQAARKDGMRSLQEEGILLVAKGVTSLPELMRVLKQ